MTIHRTLRFALAAIVSGTLTVAPGRASDHADPMSLNVFAVQQSPEANITDLHAFVVDDSGKLVTTGDPLARTNRLVISLCVRRALTPDLQTRLDFDEYTFRVHVDLHPLVRFADPADPSAAPITDPAALKDRSMQALYGGIIAHPNDIADTAILDFQVRRADHDGKPDVDVTAHLSGIPGTPTPVRWRDGEQPPRDGIGLATGLFDDPFIFPRFFRRNVVGIVTSIPLTKLLPVWPADGRPVPILLWATTHKGAVQIDHVGRSLRTQLPRFGYLNTLPPSEHVREITRVHAAPTLLEATLASVVSPLFAHRHYDSAPDVMIYDLRKPAKFPNGRALPDDVGKTLADAGETLLLELSYAESRQVPRTTTNDKAFRQAFPYLANPWTKDDIGGPASATPTAQPPDGAAIVPPNLDTSIWQRLVILEVLALGVLTALLGFTVRSNRLRAALVVVALLVCWGLYAVYADSFRLPAAGPAALPARKLGRLAIGLGWISLLAVGWVFALGRRSVTPSPATEPVLPRGRQSPTRDDAYQASYQAIHTALFDPRVSRPYCQTWGGPGSGSLPLYKTTFASITAGVSLTNESIPILRAAERTLLTHGDLRWGTGRQGFRRLVHPMGVCLAGRWTIDRSVATQYTGLFVPGSEGRVIARYSLGGNNPRNGSTRSLGMVGKVFPLDGAPAAVTPRAHFITQEDLGGTFTNSVREAVLTNSPPVTLLNRGSGVLAFLAVIVALKVSDAEPAERQLYEIAELGKPDGVVTCCPRFMRLRIEGGRPAAGDAALDFRDEILGMIYDRGDPRAQRELVFAIEVSDVGRRTWLQNVVDQDWTRIGTIRFDKAAASYNGDFVVHFHHPVWRKDRNDPASVLRPELR